MGIGRKLLAAAAVVTGIGIALHVTDENGGNGQASPAPPPVSDTTQPFPSISLVYNATLREVVSALAPSEDKATEKADRICANTLTNSCLRLTTAPAGRPLCVAYASTNTVSRYATAIREKDTPDRFAVEKKRCLDDKTNDEILKHGICQVGYTRYVCNDKDMTEQSAQWIAEDIQITDALAKRLVRARDAASESVSAAPAPAPVKNAQSISEGAPPVTVKGDLRTVLSLAKIFAAPTIDSAYQGAFMAGSCVAKTDNAPDTQAYIPVTGVDASGRELKGYAPGILLEKDERQNAALCTARLSLN